MIDQDIIKNLKSWPFKAIQIVKKYGGQQNFKTQKKGYVLFETGYGPSGLPHMEPLEKS